MTEEEWLEPLSSDPIRWSDAVRRRNPELTVGEAAELGEKLDRFTKRLYANGYDLIGIREDGEGGLEIRAPRLRRTEKDE